MPRYDYTCQECGEVFEDVVAHDAPDPLCKVCGDKDVKRHFPCPAVHFYYSPAHPRATRGKLGFRTVQKPAPLLRPDAPFLLRKQRADKAKASKAKAKKKHDS